MAKLGEEHLYTSIEIHKHYRLPIVCHNDIYFVNAGKSVIKIDEQKVLHTWTVKHPHYFSSPVICFEEYLFCILSNNTLIKWSIHDDNLDQAEKAQLTEPALAVLPIHGGHVSVLSNSGKFSVFETQTLTLLETLGSAIDIDSKEILWTNSFVEEQRFQIIFLLCDKKLKEYILQTYSVKNNSVTNSYVQHIGLETSELKHWGCNGSYFFTIWSEGKILRHSLYSENKSELLTVADIQDSIVAIDNIDSTHIVLAKYFVEKKEIDIEIWDTKFAVLKARKVLKSSDFNNLQIAVFNANIFLCYNKNLVSVSFVIEQSTLAAAISNSVSQPETSFQQPLVWGSNGEVTEVAKGNDSELMDVCDTIQQNESPEFIKLVVQKLLKQNSDHLMYLPESELVKLLKMAIRYNNKKKKSEKVYDKESDVIFNIVFSAPFSDIYLIKYLKHLSLEETMLILKLMLSYLSNKYKYPSDIQKKPSDLQILNWTHLIIQSHIGALLLLKDKKLRKLLWKLNKAVAEKMEEYETAAEIQNYIYIQRKKLLEQENTVYRYCTETLEV